MSYVSDLRVVLRGRDFRRLFATRLVSQFSDGIFQFAVGGYAFFSPERQASATAHRGGPRRAAPALQRPRPLRRGVHRPLVAAADPRHRAGRAGALLVLAAALVAAGASDAVFYAAALGVLAVNRFFLSALGASLPHVVPSEHLMMANAVTPTSGTVVTFVGAGVGVLLRMIAGAEHTGVAVLLVCSGLVFGLSALIARTMERPLLGPAYDPDRPQAREAVRTCSPAWSTARGTSSTAVRPGLPWRRRDAPPDVRHLDGGRGDALPLPLHRRRRRRRAEGHRARAGRLGAGTSSRWWSPRGPPSGSASRSGSR